MIDTADYGKGVTAYAVQLKGPSTARGTEHYLATQSQRQRGTGGTYASERVVGYRALRRAGISAEELGVTSCLRMLIWPTLVLGLVPKRKFPETELHEGGSNNAFLNHK